MRSIGHLNVPLIGGPRPMMQIKLAGGLQTVADGIERVVVDSYKTYAMRDRTEAEDKRRAKICTDWFMALVNDHRWTADRAMSELRLILKCELGGLKYKVPTSTLWVPDLMLVAG